MNQKSAAIQILTSGPRVLTSDSLANVEGEMRVFLDAVLGAYEVHGVDELALSKIGDFLKVKYGGTNGAKRVLGEIPTIKRAFMDIQAHLYAN
ncbi:MAG: type I restriction-modification enzyme R subunit C-terminal domain-containing protein [Yoonia sp.]